MTVLALIIPVDEDKKGSEVIEKCHKSYRIFLIVFILCGIAPLVAYMAFILATVRRFSPLTVELLLNLEFGAEVYTLSAFFVYIRLLDAHHYTVCTDLGNMYSAVIFVLIGILTLIYAAFGIVLTIILVFKLCRYLSRKCCFCCGHALLMRSLTKVQYS